MALKSAELQDECVSVEQHVWRSLLCCPWLPVLEEEGCVKITECANIKCELKNCTSLISLKHSETLFMIRNGPTLHFILSIDGVIYGVFVLVNTDEGC